MDSVPIELEEAAWVDGAGVLTAIRKVITPVMLPGIFTVAIYTFSGSWGNFFVPYILISSAEKYPASVMLYQFFGNHGMIAYGPLAAYSVLYAAPSILLYVTSQKYMSKGFSMQGAAKG
jgi:multiple sugar transport system permease protein